MAHGLAPLPGRSSPPADAGHVEDAAAEIPYTRHSVSAADEAAVLRALRSGRLAQGPEVAAFEAEIAALAGAEAGVAVT
ncbi:MAG: DegT/DnrJ/EryC1/StrS family aminotransferase, partial [Myxococcota bacterium]|nr:DegT/DnrJ/EryC1/StrS family aminotransferase [Myxococcota bacterium]